MALAVDEACHGGGGTAPLLQLPLLTRLTGWRVVRASCSIDQQFSTRTRAMPTSASFSLLNNRQGFRQHCAADRSILYKSFHS